MLAAWHTAQRMSAAPDCTLASSAGSSIASGVSRSISIKFEIEPSVSYFFSSSSMSGSPDAPTSAAFFFLCFLGGAPPLPPRLPSPPVGVLASLRLRAAGAFFGRTISSRAQNSATVASALSAIAALYISSESSCCKSSVNCSHTSLSVTRCSNSAGSGISSSSSLVFRLVSDHLRDGGFVAESV